MAERVRRARSGGLRRLRWRMSGAWLWPAFVAATGIEAALLQWLPVSGEGGGAIGSLLLAGCLNVAAIAVLGGIGGIVLRRRRRDLPKVVADDYAGLAALALVGLALVAAGLVHRPELQAEHEAFAAQSMAVRLWVDANGDDFSRAHVGVADSVMIDTDLYRTCVPSPSPRRWLCLIVDTSHRPPRIKRDASHESNVSQNPRGAFR